MGSTVFVDMIEGFNGKVNTRFGKGSFYNAHVWSDGQPWQVQ